MKTFHILNGDSLKQQFPANVTGENIIFRECLMEGDIEGETPEEFYTIRARFLNTYFELDDEKTYFLKTVPELEKIRHLPDNSEINLWFENDLFCQVNLWFVTNSLLLNQKKYTIFLVRPNAGNEFSFGNMDKNELFGAFTKRIKLELTELKAFTALWNFYRNRNLDKMKESAQLLHIRHPYVKHAVQAHIDRIPENGNPGRPKQTLQNIIDELKTSNFGTIFPEFCKREAIYGYGDLQVKKMLKELTDKSI